MADLFWAYWDATIRFALLASLLLAITPLLKRMIPPRLLCWAWAILLLRLALPFSLPFSGSIFNVHESLQPSAWTEAIRRGVVNAGLGETILPAMRDEDALVIATRIPISWETALMSLWLLGVAAMAARLLKNVLQLKRFFAGAERYDSGALYRLFKDTRRRLGIYANVPLLVSDCVKTPGIAGVFNPRIIVPRQCAEKLGEQELRCVFMHELTHYRRGDLFLHHALLLLCYIHWYNPLAWMVLKQFKDEMEKACDLEVVDSVCGGSAQEYGYTLLQVLQFSKGAHYSPGGALSLLGSRKSGALKERITLIAKRRRPNALLTGIGMVVFGSSFLFAMTGELDPEDEAARLVKLTRISGLFAEEALDYEAFNIPGKELDRSFSLSDELREWIQIIDASKYAGQTIRIRARAYFNQNLGSVDLWASANDMGDRSLVSETSPFPDGTGSRDFSLLIEIPKKAAKLRYGLSFRGAGMVWVDQFDLEIVDDTSEL